MKGCSSPHPAFPERTLFHACAVRRVMLTAFTENRRSRMQNSQNKASKRENSMWRSSQSDSAVRYLLVGEYRQYCRILVGVNAVFWGCVDDAERQCWQQRASEELQKAQRTLCLRAKPEDNQHFEEACKCLRRIIQQ